MSQNCKIPKEKRARQNKSLRPTRRLQQQRKTTWPLLSFHCYVSVTVSHNLWLVKNLSAGDFRALSTNQHCFHFFSLSLPFPLSPLPSLPLSLSLSLSLSSFANITHSLGTIDNISRACNFRGVGAKSLQLKTSIGIFRKRISNLLHPRSKRPSSLLILPVSLLLLFFY